MSKRYWITLAALTLMISALVLQAQTSNPLPASRFGRDLIREPNALEARNDRLRIATVSPLDFSAAGNGITDDTTALQGAIDKAIADDLELILPAGTYRITSTLEIGDGLAEVDGFAWRGAGAGLASLVWDGPNDVNMIEIVSCSQIRLEGFTIDGNDANGVRGIYHSTVGAFSSQHALCRQLTIRDCNAIGYHYRQTATATCDYLTVEDCSFIANGVNLYVEGGPRQIQIVGGANIEATTYGIQIIDGAVTIYDGLFGLNGYDSGSATQVGSDIYLDDWISQISVFGCKTESLVFLDGDWGNDAGYSRLLPINAIYGLNQADHSGVGGAVAIATVIDYNCAKPLILSGCKLMGDVALGSKCTSVVSIHTDFYNWERSSTDPTPLVGFTGTLDNLNVIGRTDNTTGDGDLTGTVLLGGQTLRVADDGWFRGIDVLEDGETAYKRVGFSDAPPVTYYARVGWISYNLNPTVSTEPLGWRCITAGDGALETTLSVWQPFYADASGLESVNLPAADDPTTDDNGDIAWDTNDLQLQAGDGTNEFYLAGKIKQFSMTIDNPDGLADPNVLMLAVDDIAYPNGITVTALAIKTRPYSTYSVTFLDYNEPNDASPVTLGVCATSSSNEDPNDIVDTTVAAGDIIVVRLPTTDIDQVQVILYAWIRTKD